MVGRLSRSADFERIRIDGARWRGKYCALNAARAFFVPNPLLQSSRNIADAGPKSAHSNAPITRIGYITSKRVGNAVQRNRARRVMRAAIQELAAAGEVPTGWDCVLIAQPVITKDAATMRQVRDELRWLFNKVMAQGTKPA
jgi:ribonuclease P protein component